MRCGDRPHVNVSDADCLHVALPPSPRRTIRQYRFPITREHTECSFPGTKQSRIRCQNNLGGYYFIVILTSCFCPSLCVTSACNTQLLGGYLESDDGKERGRVFNGPSLSQQKQLPRRRARLKESIMVEKPKSTHLTHTENRTSVGRAVTFHGASGRSVQT